MNFFIILDALDAFLGMRLKKKKSRMVKDQANFKKNQT